MPLNNPPEPTGNVKTNELIGKPIVIIDVKEPLIVTTTIGENTAVPIDVLVCAGFPGERDLTLVENVYIFWSVVQRQLLDETMTLPAAGTFTQKGRAYIFDTLPDEEMNEISDLYDDYMANHT